MNKLLFLSLAVLLSGCAALQAHIPSFWDDNQAAKITDARFAVERLDCASPNISTQISQLRDSLLWFELYSQSKGPRQTDVINLVHPMRETVEDMHKRYQDQQASVAYCEIKQRILKSQSSRAAEAILGRF